MDVGWNINTLLSLSAPAVSVAGLFWIIRKNWKQYGLLYLLSSFVGVVLCYIFIYLKLYTFPFRLFPSLSPIPVYLIITFFPLYVLGGVCYSPTQWRWKLPFYWVLVHLGVTAELLIEKNSDIIAYTSNWGIWDSYVWWWLYLLIFEWAGGLVVKPENRRPLDIEQLKFGKIGWFIYHFILIATIFLAGVFAGSTLLK